MVKTYSIEDEWTVNHMELQEELRWNGFTGTVVSWTTNKIARGESPCISGLKLVLANGVVFVVCVMSCQTCYFNGILIDDPITNR